MKKLISVAVTAAVVSSAGANADVSDAQWSEFQTQFAEMAKRVEALEAENQRLQTCDNCAPVSIEDLAATQQEVALLQQQNAASSWAEKIRVKGDFRYRYEYIDIEDANSRERNRIRARVAMTAAVTDNTEVGFGLASGGDDPVSSNQTLGGGGSSKEIRLDKAYFKWRAFDGGYLQAGKFSNPLYSPQKSGLLWDGDWRPEGVSVGWSSDTLFASALGNYLESDSKNRNDAFAWGVQAGTRLDIGGANLTASLAYFDFPTKGHKPFYDDEFFGNSSVADAYRYNYEMIELGADLGLSLSGMPLNLFVNYVQNQDADAYDTGWLAGGKLGKVSGKGSWQLAYQYQDLEADAVLGLLSDSDFAGGGTDGKGHRLSGAYGINKQWNVGFTWFINNEAGEKAFVEEGGAIDYDRIVLDTLFKY